MFRVLLATATLAALAAVTSPVDAASLAPSKPSEAVTVLINTIGGPCPTGTAQHFATSFRLNADGTQSPFVIPPKSVFVVTSFDYLLNGGEPGRYLGVSVFAAAPGAPSIGALSTAAGIADPLGRVRGNNVVPFGMVVKPPAALCGELTTAEGQVLVHGFFAKDK